MSCPGMTVNNSLSHLIYPLKVIKDQRIICIATQNISKNTLFINGLYQNIILIYKLFEILGHIPYFLINEPPTQKNADILLDGNYRCILPETIIQHPMHIDLYIEIGMSTDLQFNRYLKAAGTRIIKLYLGNALNIDTEMVTIINGISFPHHSYSDLDEIWTSPHYEQNIEYLCGIYRLPLNRGKIAPYIWDSMFIDELHNTSWIPPKAWEDTDIVIAEPNISFQKCAYLPLHLVDAFASKYPMWRGKVYCINTTRFSSNVHLCASVLPDISIVTNERVVFCERMPLETILKTHKNALFIGHQWNNEYNYMTCELMMKGFPILHNTSAWSAFGYYWSEGEWINGISLLRNTLENHEANLSKYKSDAQLLAWNYSMHNPNVQKEWVNLITAN